MSSVIKASLLILGAAATSAVNASVLSRRWGGLGNDKLEIQAHRGGMGFRTENSLWLSCRFPSNSWRSSMFTDLGPQAFAYAMVCLLPIRPTKYLPGHRLIMTGRKLE